MATINGWTDYAVLTPSVPKYKKDGSPVAWKVQINGEGRFRCSCPSYIFSKGSKACKHTRRCEELRQSEATTAPVVKPVSRWQHEAVKATDAMLNAARVFVNDVQKDAMVETLAARLRAWSPAPGPVAVPVTQAVVVGVRQISFED